MGEAPLRRKSGAAAIRHYGSRLPGMCLPF